MLDAKGGYKALFSALLRDRVEAATMYGRLCSAWEATKRGYAIELDNGPSGRLRHWRIAGVPREACDKMSKRSDAIGEYLSDTGYVGYRARNVAARATPRNQARDRHRRTPAPLGSRTRRDRLAPRTPPRDPRRRPSNWTELIEDLAFTSATITVEQPPGTLVLTVTCQFGSPTADGSVPGGNVTCVQS